jgi:2-polyprenyl-3-methyl-5-hydroxy-6-metoxy-1,4-benzoquinol methylase
MLFIRKAGFNVVGIDFSVKQIETAKKFHKHKNVVYHVQDAREIKLGNSKYDMSICMWTTYNYFSQEKDLLKFIRSNYHCQRKGGILILDSKNIPRLEKEEL